MDRLHVYSDHCTARVSFASLCSPKLCLPGGRFLLLRLRVLRLRSFCRQWTFSAFTVLTSCSRSWTNAVPSPFPQRFLPRQVQICSLVPTLIHRTSYPSIRTSTLTRLFRPSFC